MSHPFVPMSHLRLLTNLCTQQAVTFPPKSSRLRIPKPFVSCMLMPVKDVSAMCLCLARLCMLALDHRHNQYACWQGQTCKGPAH